MNKASVFEIDPTLSRGAHVAFTRCWWY